MSLIAAGATAGAQLLKAEAVRQGSKLISKIFGGNGGPNIARSLSAQVGCTILQKDADAARAALRRGINPCTGRAQGQRVSGVSAAPAISAATGIFQRALSDVFQGKNPLQQRLTGSEIEDIINRPAAGPAPPPRGGITPGQLGFPVPSRDVFRKIAVPVSPPVPPGGGRMSLFAAAGMSGLPAVIGAGARGITRTATGRIGRIFLPSGAAVSKRDATALIRRVGFEAAAIALGITAIEAAELFLQESARRRRGRGITAAQVRNARRTTRMVCNLARDLGIKAAPVRRRKTTCR